MTRVFHFVCCKCSERWTVPVRWGAWLTGSTGPLNWPPACPMCSSLYFKAEAMT